MIRAIIADGSGFGIGTSMNDIGMNDIDDQNQDGQHQDLGEGTTSLAEEIDRLRAELIAFLADNIDRPGAQGSLIPQRMIDAIDAQAKAAIARHIEGSALANPQDFAGKMMAAAQPQNDQMRQDLVDLKSQVGLISTHLAALNNGISKLGDRPITMPAAPVSIADEQAETQIKAAIEKVRNKPDWDEDEELDKPRHLPPERSTLQKLALPLTGLGGVIIGALACWAVLTNVTPAPKRDNVPPGTTALEIPGGDPAASTAAQPGTATQNATGNDASETASAADPAPAGDTAPAGR